MTYRQVPDWITSHPDLADGAKALFAAIALAAYKHDGRPTHRQIALLGGHGDASAGEKWVRRYLPTLVAAGAVEVSSGVYTVCGGLDKPPPEGTHTGSVPAQGYPSKGADGTRVGVASRASEGTSIIPKSKNNTEKRENARGRATLFPGSESSADNGRTIHGRSTDGPPDQRNSTDSTDSTTAKKAKRRRRQYPDWFDAWWKALPTIVHDTKAGAFKYLDGCEDEHREFVMVRGAEYGALAAKNPQGTWRGILVWMNADDFEGSPAAWLTRATKANGSNGHKRGAAKVEQQHRRGDEDFDD